MTTNTCRGQDGQQDVIDGQDDEDHQARRATRDETHQEHSTNLIE